MGCEVSGIGDCNDSSVLQEYYHDRDSDTHGLTYAGWHCSASANVNLTAGAYGTDEAALGNVDLVLNSIDKFDDCKCTDNELVACYDCLGHCIASGDYIGGTSPTTNTCASPHSKAGY